MLRQLRIRDSIIPIAHMSTTRSTGLLMFIGMVAEF